MKATTTFTPGRLYSDQPYRNSNGAILRFVHTDGEGYYFEYVSGFNGYGYDEDGLIGFNDLHIFYELSESEAKQFEQ
jgi:hypothetical protein